MVNTKFKRVVVAELVIKIQFGIIKTGIDKVRLEKQIFDCIALQCGDIKIS